MNVTLDTRPEHDGARAMTAAIDQKTMTDQADGLRQLIRVGTRPSRSAEPAPTATHRARSLLITSGKGGVGTSNLSVGSRIVFTPRATWAS